MKKIIIVCPSCSKKMKINNSVAKYKCPHCGAIYVYDPTKKIYQNSKNIVLGIGETFGDIKRNFIKKYSDAKATYKYMSQLKKHMKNDPNWSQYRKEQKEAKDVTPKRSFRDFFKKR